MCSRTHAVANKSGQGGRRVVQGQQQRCQRRPDLSQSAFPSLGDLTFSPCCSAPPSSPSVAEISMECMRLVLALLACESDGEGEVVRDTRPEATAPSALI